METSYQTESNSLDPGTMAFNPTPGVVALQMEDAMTTPTMYDMAKWHQAHHAIE